MRAEKWICLMGGLLAITGCASTGAPEGWLSTAEDAGRDPYGAWIIVENIDPGYPRATAGEFLCVGADSLHILDRYSSTGDFVVSFPLSSVSKARLAHFDPETGQVAGWVAAGSVSTLSHGIAAAVTLPVWLIGGSLMAASHSATPLEYFPHSSWEELRMYARFPQGPPQHLHRLGLVPKAGAYTPMAPPALPDESDDAQDQDDAYLH